MFSYTQKCVFHYVPWVRCFSLTVQNNIQYVLSLTHFFDILKGERGKVSHGLFQTVADQQTFEMKST